MVVRGRSTIRSTNPDQCDVRLVDLDRVTAARNQMLGGDSYLRLAETFRALADESRLRLIYCLLQHEMRVCDLAAVVGISESAVSQHLRQLRLLRLVRNRRAGKIVYYSLDDDHIELLLHVCLSHIRDEAEPAIRSQVLAIAQGRDDIR